MISDIKTLSMKVRSFMASKRKHLWSFLYSHDRWSDESKYMVRSYSAATLAEACDKMLNFIRRKEWEDTDDVQVDERVVEIIGKRRLEHFYDNHPLKEFRA